MAKTLKIQSSKQIISDVDLLVNTLYNYLESSDTYEAEFHKVLEGADDISPIIYKVVIRKPFLRTILFTKDLVLYKTSINKRIFDNMFMLPDSIDTPLIDRIVKDLIKED